MQTAKHPDQSQELTVPSWRMKRFEICCSDITIVYVELYSCTPTVHQTVIHSSVIIEHVLLPTGTLLEEAEEHRNKHSRQFTESFSKKCS